ncbi:MAG TPA: tRNA (guanosine(46)-N7)-methyltransferase TrmB [Pirellulales bacterium]|nr:tRNA (guanosine(46)-N7)-methyltransferase TrmB [Pirellulales bacterium]
MGRRALRKVDPSLDLSRHLRSLDDLPRPWDATLLFGRLAPLEIEVGSGKGLFLSSAAAARPEHDFLGTEVARKYALHAAARLKRRSLANACLVYGDALRVFHDHLPDESLVAVHVYFPDPWWKARHKKRRVMNARFLRDAQRALQAGGTLHFWTDVREYFESTLELIGETVQLAGPFEVAERPAEHELDYRTHFERRMRLSGLPVFRAEFRK